MTRMSHDDTYIAISFGDLLPVALLTEPNSSHPSPRVALPCSQVFTLRGERLRCPTSCAAEPRARARSVALRAQRASVRSLHAHTAPPSHTESIESAQVLSSMVPREHSCITGGSTHMSLPLSPSRLWVCPRAYFHSRAPPPTRSATLLSTPARFTARDCPILRPRAGLPLSRQAKRPLELAAARDPIFPCCRIHACSLSISPSLLFAG